MKRLPADENQLAHLLVAAVLPGELGGHYATLLRNRRAKAKKAGSSSSAHAAKPNGAIGAGRGRPESRRGK